MILIRMLYSCSLSAQEQVLQSIDDFQISFFDLLWKLENENIKNFETDGDYFYKAITLPLSESESNLDGEIKHRLYFLKGEYGEEPDGFLYLAGDYYNIMSVELLASEGDAIFSIQYGAIKDPGKKSFLIK